MKKILMVTSFYPPYHIGGAEIHVYHLANALAELGHKITILAQMDSYHLKTKKKPELSDFRNHKNVNVIFIRSKVGIFSPIFSYITGKPLSSKIKKIIEGDYDIVHYHNISLFGPEILAYKAKKKIFTVHDHWFICQMNGLFTNSPCKIRNMVDKINLKNQIFHCLPHILRSKRPMQFWRYTNLLKKGLSGIDIFVTPSQYMKTILQECGLNGKVMVIPNFIGETKYKPLQKKNYYLYVGRLEKNKGILKLIDEFSKIDEELVVAGAGELETEIKFKIKKNINLVGWKSSSELSALYSQAKATIVPSISPENFPTVALESLYNGTPVIGTNIGGLPEIIGILDKKLIFSPYNFNDLTKIIKDFEPKKYPQEKMINIVKTHFSKDAYIKVYEGLL